MRGFPCGAWLAALVLAAAAPRAHADETTGDAAHDALPGLVRLGVPAPLERGFVFAASGSYGYTGDVLGEDDRHHRAGGTLAFSYRPRDWIGVALRLDGRHDAHSGNAGDDDGWIADTRLELRLVAPRAGALGYGGSLTLWFPSSSAFRPEGDAISFDGEGWLAWHVAPRVALVAGAGVRVDRSAHSAPTDAALLSRADRLALGVGEGTDLLVGAGATYRIGDRTSTFLEWSWDVPVAGDAKPRALEAPMRADVGLRYRLAGGPTLEASAELGLSKRPDLMATVPLEPVEPRFSLLVAATWSFGGATRTAPVGTTTTDETVVTTPPPALQKVRGRLVTPSGDPLAGVHVHIGAREAMTGADGSFELDGVPAGEATLEADVPLPWAKISTPVVVGGGAPLALGDVPVARALPPGQIRGVVRTLTGKPVAAQVTLEPLGQHLVAGDKGEFRVDVPPGEYDVVVEAPGFTPQKRHVVVDENGVTVLNIDLRTARPGQGQDR